MTVRMLRAGWIGALCVTIPAFAAVSPQPGTVNYIEGQVSIDGRAITSKAIGEISLRPESILRTESGHAEVLLTPGVFLRLGNNSEIRMVSAGLTDTRVAVDRGTVLLEATEVHDENRIQVADASLTTTINKEGLYRFDADRSSVSVFDGKADVRQGDSRLEVKKGKEVLAGSAPLEAKKFDIDEAKKNDELYRWSKLRSKYLAEASEATAQRIIVGPGGWYGAGWYWNPWWHTYSWLPGRPFFSPFGYRFYSPYRRIYVVPRHRIAPRAWGHRRVR